MNSADFVFGGFFVHPRHPRNSPGLFHEDHCIILDSIHGVQELNATSTIKYLWRESQSPSFGCAMYVCMYTFAKITNTIKY